MKKKFWLWERDGVFYLDDSQTRQKECIHTRDRQEAERIQAISERCSKAIGEAQNEIQAEILEQRISQRQRQPADFARSAQA